jgi:hypothetical protein
MLRVHAPPADGTARAGDTTPRPKETAMNALDLLKKDHETVKDILERLEDCDEMHEREELFHKLREELQDHETIEEEIFYPTLKQIAKAKEVVLEGYEEHQVVDYILEDMSGLPVDDDSWMAKLAVARENIEHHIKEEESEMFKHARKAFDSDELDELGARLHDRKVELQMSHH